jgi:hypothetical protein
MQGVASLTLIVPGLGVELARAAQALEVPQLARLAARGSLRYAWDRSDLAHAAHCAWQRGLLWALQLAPAAHPSAALCALVHGIDGSAVAQGTDSSALAPDALAGEWLHLELVHLAAGLNHLSLVELGIELQPTPEERASLEPLLREHLQAHGARWHALPSGRWLVRLPVGAQLRTVCPAAAAANELELAMPQAEGGAVLRRLMTELQMLLHEHVVNRERERRGWPAANALWPWGNGALVRQAPRSLPMAFGTHDYLCGIYRHYGSTVQCVPSSAGELIEALRSRAQQGATQALVVLEAPALGHLEQHWLVPLVQALRARRLARLDLILDGWHLGIDRRGLRRFWRRPLPPGSWVA